MHFQPIDKVIQPKYYQHLKEAAHPSQTFGQIKMGRFLVDYLVHQVTPKILHNIIIGI